MSSTSVATTGRVLNLASLNIDSVGTTSKIPALGETVLGGDFYESLGGKGGNQAVAAARLGASVSLIGRVGNDSGGARYLAALRAEGIDVSNVAVDREARTGVALVEVDSRGENSILVLPGANARISREQLQAARPVVRDSNLVMAQLETPTERVRDLLGAGRRSGCYTMLNPAPAVPLSEIEDVVSLADVLVPNLSEVNTLLGRSVAASTNYLSVLKPVFDLGVSFVVVTLGGDGAVVASHENSVRIPPRSVDVVDTTAAGDTFVGALAAYLSGEEELTFEGVSGAAEWATVAAALTVSRRGAHTAIPSRQEVQTASTITRRQAVGVRPTTGR